MSAARVFALPGSSSAPLPGLGYGLLGAPLAFAALPLYVLLPHHYAHTFGVPLAPLGLLLLVLRLLDAAVDPWIGQQVDRLLQRPALLRRWAVAGAVALWLGFVALFFPPLRGVDALLAWCAGALALCYAGYSLLMVMHQAWGARLGELPAQRARVAAWREGCALLGVLAASVLPGSLGLASSSGVLAVLLVLGLLLLLRQAVPTLGGVAAAAPPATAAAALWAPLRQAALVRLLLVYLLNGVASALPATLVLFFVRDRLQAADSTPLFLGAYFAAAALSLPLWVRLVRRVGLARCWLLGMVLAVLAFVGSAALGPGDGGVFVLICVASGVALGADLSAPPALLAGWVRQQTQVAEGAVFGWWQLVTKLNLALAAGLGLPLLAALGYQPGQPDVGPGLTPLVVAYALLPCALKLLAALGLWLLWIKKEGMP